MIQDTYRRELRSLRISVTDRCNLRCRYCMPEPDYVWLPRESILRFEEIERLVRIFAGLGVRKIRLTGGEPTLRNSLDQLVRLLAAIPKIRDIALTTNATRLSRFALPLRAAGLHRITVSLDTLRPDRFQPMTGADNHREVLEGITAAAAVGFPGLKINTVIIRGYNDDEIIDLLEFGRERGAEVRFIEYMDVGGATRWSQDQVVARREILSLVSRQFGGARPLPGNSSAPAERFVLPDGTRFGIIASVTEPFCSQCDRARLTADGMLFFCLYAMAGINLRTLLRSGAADPEIAAAIGDRWKAREDRGAELRSRLPKRIPLARAQDLKRHPHLEMHTRGG